MLILATASEKGGAGKTTVAVNLAAIAAESWPGRVLLLDTDPSGGADWWVGRADKAGAVPGLDFTHDKDPSYLQHLRRQGKYDVVIVDTAPVKDDAIVAEVIKAADGVVMPTKTAPLDVRGLSRMIRGVVQPLGKPFLVVLNQVEVASIARAESARTDLVEQGWRVASVLIRNYKVHQDAIEAGLPMTRYRAGRYSREADTDCRRLAFEVFTDRRAVWGAS